MLAVGLAAEVFLAAVLLKLAPSCFLARLLTILLRFELVFEVFCFSADGEVDTGNILGIQILTFGFVSCCSCCCCTILVGFSALISEDSFLVG